VQAKEILQCKSTKLLEPFLLQPLVEIDESSVVYQLSMINQTLCTWVSEGFFPGVAVVDIYRESPYFLREAKMVKFHFSHSKLTKQPVFANSLMRKSQLSNSREGPRTPSASLPTPMVLYRVTAGKFTSWLTFPEV